MGDFILHMVGYGAAVLTFWFAGADPIKSKKIRK